MIVDKYLAKRFNSKSYNCFDFAREIWLELTNVDLGDQSSDISGIEQYHKRALKVANTLEKIDSVQDPCLVLLRRARIEPHIGVYHKGRVLHLSRSGAYYMPLDQVTPGYPDVSFYK